MAEFIVNRVRNRCHLGWKLTITWARDTQVLRVAFCGYQRFIQPELQNYLSLCHTLNLDTIELQPSALLFGLLQFSIKPAVSLIGDKQDNEVTLIEAQQGVVTARFVGEDSPDTWPLAHIVQPGSHRNGSDHLTPVIIIICWLKGDEIYCGDPDPFGM